MSCLTARIVRVLLAGAGPASSPYIAGPAPRFYGSGRHSSSSSNDWIASLVGLALLVLVVLLALSAYALFRMICLVVRVAWHHPHHRVLWSTIGCCLLGWALVGLAAAVSAPDAVVATLALLALLATIAVPLVAKIIEWRDDHLLQRRRTADTLIEDVLRRPWWEAA